MLDRQTVDVNISCRKRLRLLAFTLAEVLITLGIIGIVAEMTIPTLMNNVQDAQYKSALKKNFSVFSQIYLQIQTDGGTFQDGISACTDAATKHTCFKNIIKPYLKVVNDCDSNNSLGVCFPSTIYEMDRSVVPVGSFFDPGAAGLLLNDGTSVMIVLDGSDCPITRGTFTGECGWINVDVNGLKKPNTMGKDIYNFMFYKDRLRPTGGTGDGYEYASYCVPSHGVGCAAKYLQGN